MAVALLSIIAIHSQSVQASNQYIDIELSKHEQSFNSRNLQSTSVITQYNVENFQDSQYYAMLYVGSARVALEFMINTTSSWTWLPSINCTACPNTKFAERVSRTFNATRSVFNITAMNGTVFGNLTSDVVSLGPTGAVNASNVKFLLVNRSQSVGPYAFDGVLGLAPTFFN
jgi:hypothetical protein